MAWGGALHEVLQLKGAASLKGAPNPLEALAPHRDGRSVPAKALKLSQRLPRQPGDLAEGKAPTVQGTPLPTRFRAPGLIQGKQGNEDHSLPSLPPSISCSSTNGYAGSCPPTQKPKAPSHTAQVCATARHAQLWLWRLEAQQREPSTHSRQSFLLSQPLHGSQPLCRDAVP